MQRFEFEIKWIFPEANIFLAYLNLRMEIEAHSIWRPGKVPFTSEDRSSRQEGS